MTCITLRLKLWGRLGSFFLKKYIITKLRAADGNRNSFVFFYIHVLLPVLYVVACCFPPGDTLTKVNDLMESHFLQQERRPMAALACSAIQ